MDFPMNVVKRHKRLWIMDGDVEIYTPPNFIQLQSREPMFELARQMDAAGGRSITAIIEFETRYSKRKIKL